MDEADENDAAHEEPSWTAVSFPDYAQGLRKALDPYTVFATEAARLSSVMSSQFTVPRVAEVINQFVEQEPGAGLRRTLDAMSAQIESNKAIAETVQAQLGNVLATDALVTWVGSFRREYDELFSHIRQVALSQYPPNWLKSGDVIDLPDDLEDMLLVEGLPLAWVPPVEVLEALFAATSADERLDILGLHVADLVDSCLDQLAQVSRPELQESAAFAVESGMCLNAGYWGASQALSTNLLDSVLRKFFGFEGFWKKIVNQNTRIDWADYPFRPSLVIGGLSGAYGAYWPDRGDRIPLQYSRHASAHGVSDTQYRPINALIALMHLVGLLRVMECEFEPFLEGGTTDG